MADLPMLRLLTLADLEKTIPTPCTRGHNFAMQGVSELIGKVENVKQNINLIFLSQLLTVLLCLDFSLVRS